MVLILDSEIARVRLKVKIFILIQWSCRQELMTEEEEELEQQWRTCEWGGQLSMTWTQITVFVLMIWKVHCKGKPGSIERQQSPNPNPRVQKQVQKTVWFSRQGQVRVQERFSPQRETTDPNPNYWGRSRLRTGSVHRVRERTYTEVVI